MANLKDLRDQTGRTQEDIAAEFGISRKYLSQLENNRRKPGRKLAETIAAFYHISPAELLGYRVEEMQRELLDERDSYKSRLERERHEHAREVQALQIEIDRLKKDNEDLKDNVKYLKKMGNYIMDHPNSSGEAKSEKEEAKTDKENV